MALFGARKKKEEPKPCCACGCGADMQEGGEAPCCPETEKGVCCVKVLGTGCRSCRELLENAKEAVEKMGLSVEVGYVTDMEKIMVYGVMRMPALVINEKVASMGRVLKTAEIERLFETRA